MVCDKYGGTFQCCFSTIACLTINILLFIRASVQHCSKLLENVKKMNIYTLFSPDHYTIHFQIKTTLVLSEAKASQPINWVRPFNWLWWCDHWVIRQLFHYCKWTPVFNKLEKHFESIAPWTYLTFCHWKTSLPLSLSHFSSCPPSVWTFVYVHLLDALH